MMKKLLIICGPTATGKTDLAIKLAKKFGGEVVSADSRQVYKGMDVGTGKDINKQISKFQISNKQSLISRQLEIKLQITNYKFSRQLAGPRQRRWQIGYYEIKRVKIWLYDIVEPDYRFNVADYKECADLVINDILNRGKLPILVGGTGFYIKAVVDGIETLGVPPDWELRKRLLNCSIVELLNLLKRLDSQRAEKMNDSDKNNPRRLIRAIEIAYWKCEARSEKSFDSELRTVKLLDKEVGSEKKKSYPTSVLLIGLTASYNYLYQRIDQRVEERIKSGVEAEIKKLLNLGFTFVNSALGTTIGYCQWQPYFESKSTTDEVIKKWKFAEHAYARRQMTWFKKDKKINWFDISKNDWEIKVEKSVEKWLSNMMG